MVNTWERDRLLEIVYTLMNEYGLGEYFLDHANENNYKDHYMSSFFDPIEQDLHIRYMAGETKGVIVHPDLNWVIKFTLCDEYNDYCGREYENYLAAKDLGLEHYFAEMAFLADFGSVAFYAQEKVSCEDEDADYAMSENLRARYESDGIHDYGDLYDQVEDMDADERVDLLYGDPELCNFVYHRRINDLHAGNFGTKNGNYIIIDYSGYGSYAFG